MKEQEIVKAFYDYYKEFPYDTLEVKFIFTLGGSYDIYTFYYKDNNKNEGTLDGRELYTYERQVHEYFETKIDSIDQFNIVLYTIKEDGSYSISCKWESENANQNLLDYAEVFYRWVNDRMMSMIFEFEKDNNLVPTQYDSDGDLEYLSSWDSGIFTFHINEKNNLEYKVVLTQDGKERILDLPLKDYFVEGILDHYLVTNNELSNEWKPWNTMILKSNHNDIPHYKRGEFVSYILE
ncbi:hypothetical protein [Flavobacterium ustbae]|uniref:hypothetical protein n=1 Tax=Flavobacterium ustbae TaxID=2488790 RepID=UPI000F791109|nr:hypothetical protein [Flavobacterium ustbae]